MKNADYTGHARRLLRFFASQSNPADFDREISFTETWINILEKPSSDPDSITTIINEFDTIDTGKHGGNGELAYYFERWKKGVLSKEGNP